MGQENVVQLKQSKRARFSAWFRKKSFGGQIRWMIFFLFILFIIAIERYWLSDFLLGIRKYGPIIIAIILFFYGVYRFAKGRKILGKIVTFLAVAGFVSIFIFLRLTPLETYNYLSEYQRYMTLQRVSISMLPETDHEAIQSHICIKTVAAQQLTETEEVSNPHLVRDSATYRWTMAKEPSTHYWVKRLSEGVKLVYSVPAEVSSLRFSGENQSPVNFSIGQTLLLGEEASVATLRSLSLFDLFTTQVGEPRFMRDNHHQWVQVIPLVKWTGHGFWGIFFPQPEFGGVQVIKQGDGECSFFSVACAQRALCGAGTTYTPEEMQNIPYLKNQNVMPTEVVKSIANSFRFQKGFMAPLPMYHNGDTRIPEIDGGIGNLPATAFFKMSGVAQGTSDMLYEYVGLEPFDTTKHGLVTSLFVPADGGMTVFVHNHVQDVYSGVSAVPGNARESKQQIDWSQSKIADVRPYNKKIGGTTKPFWLFNLVTKAQSSHGYAAGVNSFVGVVSPLDQVVVWLDPNESAKWPAQLDSMFSKK